MTKKMDGTLCGNVQQCKAVTQTVNAKGTGGWPLFQVNTQTTVQWSSKLLSRSKGGINIPLGLPGQSRGSEYKAQPNMEV